MKSTTKTGSHADLIATIVAGATMEAGRGFEIAEIRDAYEETGREIGDRTTFNAEVYSLVRRGILIRSGGRTGRTRYCHRDQPVQGEDATWDDGMVVLQALRSIYEALERAVTTREVHEEVRRLGLPLSSEHPNLVRKRLQTLSRSRERGHPDWHEPRVEMVRKKTQTGRPIVYWFPAGEKPGEVEEVAWSGAEAARRGFEKVQEELGRPATRQELRWWADASRSLDPIANAIDLSRLARDTRSAARWDRSKAGGDGRLFRIDGDLRCHGGAPPYFAVGDVEAATVEACRLEELVAALRPAVELEDVQYLLDLADLVGSQDLERFAFFRRSVLANEIRGGFGRRLSGAVALARQALERLAVWADHPSLSQDVRGSRRREVEDRVRQVAAVELLPQGDQRLPDVAVVGTAGLSDTESLTPLLASIGDLLELDGKAQLRLLAAVRRFPNPSDPGSERFKAAAENPLSLLDRVDAIGAIYQAASVPAAGALIEDAQQLLGRVIRDAELVERLLQHLPAHDHVVRRAVVVALGMLGRVPELEIAVPDPSNPEDTAAYSLAAVLGAPGDAYSYVRTLDQRAEGPARDYVYDVVGRIDVGDLVTAIE